MRAKVTHIDYKCVIEAASILFRVDEGRSTERIHYSCQPANHTLRMESAPWMVVK